MWVGCDGGVYRTDNATGTGNIFTSLNKGLQTLTMNYLGQHPTEDAVVFCGTQDNGGERFTGEETWLYTSGGDSGYFVVNWNDPYKVVDTYVRQRVRRSINRRHPLQLRQLRCAAQRGRRGAVLRSPRRHAVESRRARRGRDPRVRLRAALDQPGLRHQLAVDPQQYAGRRSARRQYQIADLRVGDEALCRHPGGWRLSLRQARDAHGRGRSSTRWAGRARFRSQAS